MKELPEGQNREVVLGYDGLLAFFGVVMQRWGEKVQERWYRGDFGAVVVAPDPSAGGGAACPTGKAVSGASGSITAKRGRPCERTFPGREDCHSHWEARDEIYLTLPPGEI